MRSGDAGDGEKNPGEDRPANDNRPPKAKDVKPDSDVSERLDAVVQSIAGLIGRQMAREDFEALQAANDNRKTVHMPEEQANRDEDD